MRAQPKYATPRDPSAPNAGARIARIAALMGKPLMPWQRLVADVATEREPDGSLRYDLVMVSVPRQAGKTTLLGAMAIERMLSEPGLEIQYTAQTGKDAGKRFRDLVKLLQGSPLEQALSPHYRYSAGGMAIELQNESRYLMFAPVQDAIHGDHPHMVLLDEIWAHSEVLGDAIYDGAVIPAQTTLGGRAQNWLVSTAGTAASTFMRKWVERGRRGRPKMAYFEWGLAEGDDPYDLEAIARFHPAVGYTQTAQQIVDIGTGNGQGEDEGMSRAEYLRALCNLWTEALDPLMSAGDWADLAKPMAVPARSSVAITYDVAPDNEAGRVLATWRDADGNPCGRVLHAAPGTRWMLAALLQLEAEWQPAVIGADDGGPTRRLTDELRRRLGVERVVTTGGKDFGTAWEGFMTAARDDRTLRHDGSTVLAREMAAVVQVRTGDTVRASRAHSPAPVAGLIAFAVGIWLWDHQQQALGKPEVGVLEEVPSW